MQTVVIVNVWALTAIMLLGTWYLYRVFRGPDLDMAARRAFHRLMPVCAAPTAILASVFIAIGWHPVEVGQVTLLANLAAGGAFAVAGMVMPFVHEQRRIQHAVRLIEARPIDVPARETS
ncbi:hypothetical protein [Mycobacteroides abscessus]|uniref:hypothetical protein n=1 Tax=Mycobacteroides abscessus TaxID=36809 RepID=UPI0009A7BA2E|nr:hypothetical protein [Mycobacteroides abscessus]SKK25051.1 Uncharacterised protein [Mycobacteroides abscessus subsp. massiliense]SKK30261.1 Uncharacterised protein [Mycobacteroides abscessus subsp. massiliense]SKK50604.1 Uncharacterised protein [Mycobacteroides abscessus subsp. massiliense]